MALLLGLDTGGTYTDAVIFDDAAARVGKGVIAKAKALTTRRDLSIGIGEAIGQVLAKAGVRPSHIALVSLSTTLATNALVEGQGGRVCLVFIGFAAADLERAGLSQALRGDPVILCNGGHTALGDEQGPLDLAALEREVRAVAPDVTGFAVAAHFATRNPAHELAARALIRNATGMPVTCSHELSAKLNGPKRALTCLLNARLLTLIHHLISALEGLLTGSGIDAPLMVVRGDGALISAEFAKMRPIETILSGPAASLVGAAYLTDRREAMVSDIGGTTTDIAIMLDGKPRIDPEGALVGGWRTMVEAVAMYTHGLGGDSEVAFDEASGVSADALKLGPRRLVPLSLLAAAHPDVVHSALDRQLEQAPSQELAGRFVVRLVKSDSNLAGLGARELALMSAIGAQAAPLDLLVTRRPELAALNRLVSLGLVSLSGFTPSDAAHVLGRQTGWDAEAACKGALLLARKKNARGDLIWPDADAVATAVVAALERQSAELLLEAGFAEDGFADRDLSRSALARAALNGHSGHVRVDIGLNTPIIGLGASAPLYYPGIARLLGAPLDLPQHGDVANAIGAVVGHVRIKQEVFISEAAEGVYRVNIQGEARSFSSPEAAADYAERVLDEVLRQEALAAGAGEVSVRVSRDIRRVTVEGQPKFVDGSVTAVASGRPRIAHEQIGA